jgi:hypothetical protein
MRYAKQEIKGYGQQRNIQINIIEVSKVRYLLFVKTDGSKICIDLNDKNDICGVLLFDGKQDPKLTDMMNIGAELQQYFQRY